MLFHGKGRNGKRHVAAVGFSPSRSDYKSAEHKKSSSGATWIFCMEPNCFGIIKGEQPLVCNGDDRDQWPKQGGAVGAAACKMRVPLQGTKQMQGAATRIFSAEKYFFICSSEKSADFSELLFHGGAVTRRCIFLLICPDL